MKRFLAALAALCLICGAARAEAADGSLRVIDVRNAAQAYQACYPDRGVTVIRPEYDEDRCQYNTQELLLGGDWDVACVSTDECDLAALCDAGVLMDLSAEETCAVRVGGMYPAIQNAVRRNGRLLGVPVYLWGLVSQFSFPATVRLSGEEVDLRAKLGFTDEDAPRTFSDLCALAEKYMALPAETRKGTAFSIDSATGNACAYFLYYLIDLYTAQACDADGNVAFDTPTFRAALSDLDAMTEALNGDPRVRYDGNGNLCGVIRDESAALLNGDALLINVGAYECVPARLEVVVINAKTERLAEALDYLAIASQQLYCTMAPLLYEQIDYDALLRQSYDADIAAQVEEGEAQSVIDELTRLRDAGDESRYYARADIEAYARNAAPYLTFPRVPRVGVFSLAQRYASGRLDADGLIAELNAQAAGNVAQ